MDRARTVSKIGNRALLDAYRNGALVPHTFTDATGETRMYSSWADSEAILAPVNNIQSDENLREFLSQFNEKVFSFGDQSNLRITGIKITPPSTLMQHDILPPSPYMTDEEILTYKWPNGAMNRSGDSYAGILWVDIGSADTEFDEDDAGTFIGRSLRESRWEPILSWPIMVGSNKDNVAILRSYLNDDTYMEEFEMTVHDRTEYLLHELLSIEMRVPDGYFVVQGKMKRINVEDKLQMNMIYTIEVATQQSFGDKRLIPVGHRVCEVRSLKAELGLAYLQLFLTMPGDITVPRAAGSASEEGGRNRMARGARLNREVFKFYSSIISMMIDKEFEEPINVFDIVRGYALIMDVATAQESMDLLVQYVSEFSSNNIEIMRPLLLTYEAAQKISEDDVRSIFRRAFIARSTSISDTNEVNRLIQQRLRKKFLPHCEIMTEDGDLDQQRTYEAKVRFLAMMVVELMLSVLDKVKVTNRKDFAFKRWESPGYLLRDYVRSMLHLQSDVRQMNKGMDDLLRFMNQNQWPSRYRARGVYKQQKTDHRDGVVDDVPRYNVVSMVDSLRTVKIPAKSGVNTAAIRRIHGSQWGYQCPANTPENANIGLNNNLGEAVLISDELTPDERISLYRILDDVPEGTTLLLVDGCPYRYVDERAYETLLQMRRSGDINRGVGIARHLLWAEALPGVLVIVVRTAHGRPLLPLFILDQEETKLSALMELDENVTMDELLSQELVEYIDPYEMVYNVVVAPWIYDAQRSFEETGTLEYTHSMIMPGHIYSTATNCLIYPGNEPSARETYATQHLKQAIGRPFKYTEQRFDHETNYLNNPEPPLISTDTARRIGPIRVGRNLHFAFMPFDGNVDDAIFFSESFANRPDMHGQHFNIFESERGITETDVYNWQLDEKTMQPILDPRTGQGLIDPDFSDSVIVPYGASFLQEVDVLPRSVRLSRFTSDPFHSGVEAYPLEDGKLYIRYGTRRIYTLTYRNNATGEETTRDVRLGEDLYNLPGQTIVSSVKGPRRYVMALAYVRQDKKSEYDTPFVSNTPLFSFRGRNWYGPVMARIPRIRTGNTYTNMGMLTTIRPKRPIIRNEVAVRVLERDKKTGRVIDVHKERFDITYGVIEGIKYGTNVKIKGAMPIGPKPGNKYAALYAQKAVCAKIIPRDRMPKARYINDVTGEEEEMEFDALFNPLGFPSRMTMGMQYEAYIAGTLDYLYNIATDDGTLRDLYENDRDAFDDYMRDTYSIDDGASLIDYLSDETAYLYDPEEKRERCRLLRGALGIPESGLYDLYLRDPETGEWNRRIDNQIMCGTVYYVALRHLVDNKRRARGYVGKRDPLTFQPVKGRRRNGGANTGTMETDAYKAHGASAMLHERMSKVSDHKVMLKCPVCGGLVSFNKVTNTYKCVECETILQPNEVIEHDTVMSWHLFRNYCRALGITISEHFSDSTE